MVFMYRQRMKDLLLRAPVVVRTSNMKISRRRLADYVKTLHQKACCTCSTIIFLHSTNKIIDLWRWRWRCRRQILNSLIPRSRRWKYNPFPVAIDFEIFPAVFQRREHVGRGYWNTVCFALFNITPAVADGKSSHRFFLLFGIRCTVIVALCALPVKRPFPSSSSVSLPKRV